MSRATTLCRAATALILSFSALALASADWPMFGGNPAHSGLSAELVPPTIAIKWTADLGGSSVDSSPAVVGDRVFAGNSEGNVFCLSFSDGSPVWRFHTAGAVVSSPAVAGGKLFAGSADRFLYALDAATGKLLWRCRTLKPVVGSPVVVADRVLFASMDGIVRAVAADTGAILWKAPPGPAGFSAAPAVVGDTVIAADEAGNVLALALGDGHQLWRAKVAGPVMATPSISGNSAIVPVMAPTAISPRAVEYLVALDLTNGNKVWGVLDPKGAAVSAVTTPAVVGTGCYFTTTEGYLSESKLRCVGLADGALLWQVPLAGIVDSSPAATADALFFGCHDGALHRVSLSYGRPIATIPLATRIYSSPALSGGKVFIGVQGGKLICLG